MSQQPELRTFGLNDLHEIPPALLSWGVPDDIPSRVAARPGVTRTAQASYAFWSWISRLENVTLRP